MYVLLNRSVSGTFPGYVGQTDRIQSHVRKPPHLFKIPIISIDDDRLVRNATDRPLRSLGYTSSHFTDNILRVGVNYHFNGPVDAKY
jgi:hypothetical protein